MTVCWHDSPQSCRANHLGGHLLIYWGRCRTGKRWFWTAADMDGPREDGREDTEDAALRAARAAVTQLAVGRPAIAILRHGEAELTLKAAVRGPEGVRPAGKPIPPRPADRKDRGTHAADNTAAR